MSTTYEVGQTIVRSVKVYDAAGALANTGTTPTCTVTLPDGTTSSATVANSSTGVYTATLASTQAGQHSFRWTASGTNSGGFPYTDTVDVIASPPLLAVGLDDVKSHLNIPADKVEDDDEIRQFIHAATSAIEQRTGPITRRTVTETHDGGGQVLLREYPVISLTTITDNGITLTSGQYRERHGVVTKKSGTSAVSFTTALDGVSVTYVAGRTVVPADLRQAVLEMVRHLWTTQRGQMRGSRTGDDYVAGQGYSLPNRVLELIAPYERPSIA